jgi:signal transduction histidine kinase
VNALINDSVQKRNSINVLSLDLIDDFGSVSHDLIGKNLEDLGILENIRKLVMKSYEDAYIQIQTKDDVQEELA